MACPYFKHEVQNRSPLPIQPAKNLEMFQDAIILMRRFDNLFANNWQKWNWNHKES